MKNKRLDQKVLLVAHGVNLDLLGQRESHIYGSDSLARINQELSESFFSYCHLLKMASLKLEFFQSNHEGDFLEKITEKSFAGLLINPGAWSHTSIALADRLKAVSYPYIEVHLSNISAREPFRHMSYLSPGAAGVVYGLGKMYYMTGLFALMNLIKSGR